MKQKRKWLLLFLAPYSIGAAVFILLPLGYSLLLSLTNASLFASGVYTGFANYTYLANNKIFIQSLQNTAYYAILVVPLEVVIALMLALLLQRKSSGGAALFRIVIYMPFVFSLISIGLVWSWMFAPTYGFFPQLASLFNFKLPAFLADRQLAMPAIAMTTLWRNIGYYTTIFIAGLQSMPQDLYEAAHVDGASRTKTFFSITLPLMTPTIFFAMVVATIWAWQVFDLTYTMTKGGPARATLSTGLLIYNTAFIEYKVGRASAQSWILLLVILTLTGLYFAGQKKWVFYENK